MASHRRRRTAIVPRLVFQTAVAGVIPAVAVSCGGSTEGDESTQTATGGSGGSDVIALAVGGFGNGPGTGGRTGSGGTGGGDIIALAVGGFGNGPGTGGRYGTGGGDIIVLAIGGFGNSPGTGGVRARDAGSEDGAIDGSPDDAASGGQGGGLQGTGGDIIILAINGFGLLSPEAQDGEQAEPSPTRKA